MAEVETTVFGAVGEQVILPCIDKSQSDGVTWKYNELVVIQHQTRLLRGRIPNSPHPCPSYRARESPLSWGTAFTHSLFILPKGRSPLTSRSELNKQEMAKGNFSLILSQLEHSDAGKYVCVVGSRTFKVQLQVCKTDDETIAPHTSVCSPLSALNSGFHNLNKETLYKAVNSTVSFSYFLSTHLGQIRELEYIRGGLEWKPMIDSKYQEKFNFNVTAKEPLLSKQMANMQATWKPSNPLEVKLPKVQFEDAGWYQCQLTVSRGRVEKAIYLVVMTVSADPVGPLSKWANMTLLCKLSAPIPPNAQLFWEHVNGTEKKLNMLGHSEVMVKTKTVGLWRCSLKVENNMMTSIDYTVVKAAEWNIYVLIGAVVGASIVLLLLASLFIFICTARQRRRRRAEKMARARRDLMERRICQCQR
uniref:Ig-like domain-containing protein n=1 Tax=Chelonoidis abingdonii TaxID=106734 RepID=A0A8C0H114_CHEAB